MKECYVVLYQILDDGDFECDVLDHAFYADRDSARSAMIADFDAEKSDTDEIDNVDESHSIDSCTLSKNLVWSKTWWVLELSGHEETK